MSKLISQISPGIWVLVMLLSACGIPMAHADEENFWPIFVEQKNDPAGRPDHVGSLGPFISVTETEQVKVFSIRPLFNTYTDKVNGSKSRHVIYPFFNWIDRGDKRYGSATGLVQYHRHRELDETFFQLFPIIFSRQTQRPEDSYFAFWPVGGVLKNRWGKDHASFVAWPLWVRTVRGDETRHHFPYPFLRTLNGPNSSGFGVWPLFGFEKRENDYHHRFALWPFHYNLIDDMDQEVPYERFAILPFYQSEKGNGLESRTFVWPFFGYTRESAPRPVYSENRYFWPFLVQGRGEEQYKNRWFPVYTHEKKPGLEKNWYMWPFLWTRTFTSPGMVRERTNFLYFIYKQEVQHFNDTTASLRSLWPIYSYRNNGYGHTQFQALDPLTVFFPGNLKVKENWTSLFALYRYDNRQGDKRHSVLWDLVVLGKDGDGMKQFQAGPLFEWVRDSHWDILKGLIGSEVENGERKMRFFWRR